MVSGRGAVNRAVQVPISAANDRIQLRSCLSGQLHSVHCSWQEKSLSLRSANVSHQPDPDLVISRSGYAVLESHFRLFGQFKGVFYFYS